MKKIILFFCLFICVYNAQSQSKEYDDRLLEVYDQDFLERLENQSAQMIDLLLFELDNSTVIHNLQEGKQLVYDGEITFDKDYNILAMLKNEEVEQTQYVKKYYKIKGEDKVFVVLSKNEIVNNYKKKQR